MDLPKYLLFDLGGVIEKISPSNVGKAFKKLGMNNPEQFFSISGQSRLCEDFELGKIKPIEFIHGIQDALPNASAQDIIQAWNANLLGIENETIHVLKTLKQRGHCLYILSNTNQLHFEAIQESFQLKHHFEFHSLFNGLFVSYQMGLRKPTEAFFKHVIEKLDLSNPKDAIFIDDLEVNTKAAKQLGLQTYTHTTNDPIHALVQ